MNNIEKEEAIEERLNMNQEDVQVQKQPEGEDLMEKVDADYQAINKLDQYDDRDFDEDRYSNMSLG